MTNKAKLQAELLAKIKPGTKPSDLKKPSKKPSKKPRQTLLSPPPIEINRDDGYKSDNYVSEEETNPSPSKSKGSKENIIPIYSDQKNLRQQITSLKKQLKLYQDFKEADLKIKEKQKQEITDLNLSWNKLEQQNNQLQQNVKDLQTKLQKQEQIITDLKNQAQTKENIKSESIEPQETKTFTCSDCNQEKPQSELSRVFGSFSFCLECSKKARQTAKQKQTPQPQSFICVVCDEPKQTVPIYQKVDISNKTHLVKGQAYPVCSTCAIHVKEYNEHENQEFSIGED
jgi:hypothetical protein